jgi:hypothetical protein
VVFDVFLPAGSVALHNMPALARAMVGISSDDAGYWRYNAPKKMVSCDTRYQAPTSDEDAETVLSSAQGDPVRRVGRANVQNTFRGIEQRDVNARATAPQQARLARVSSR